MWTVHDKHKRRLKVSAFGDVVKMSKSQMSPADQGPELAEAYSVIQSVLLVAPTTTIRHV